MVKKLSFYGEKWNNDKSIKKKKKTSTTKKETPD